MMRAADINIAGNYIFGLPFDTQETMEGTLNFALENPTEMTNKQNLAYQEVLYIEARNDGLLVAENYSGYSQHAYDTTNLPNDNLSAAQILKFRDYGDKYR